MVKQLKRNLRRFKWGSDISLELKRQNYVYRKFLRLNQEIQLQI